jgi:hypothetical protein
MSEIVARAERAVEASDLDDEWSRYLPPTNPAFIRVNKCQRCLQCPCRGHWVHVWGEVGP